MKKNGEYNSDFFSTFAEWLCIALILICVGALIYLNVCETSVAEVSRVAQELVPGMRKDLAPEHREQVTFVALSLISPIICIAIIYICRIFKFKLKQNLPERRMTGWIIGMNIFILTLAATCFLGKRQFMYMLFTPIWENYFLLALVMLLSMMMIYVLLRFDLHSVKHKLFCFLLFSIPLIQIFCCRLYTLDRIDMNQETFHLNIIAYAISQAVAGASDYHQYGFYARMLTPVFKVINPSIFNISVVMGILFFIACLAIYRVMLRCIKNKILILGFAIILFFTTGSWGFLHLSENLQMDPYYAYYPIRFICPALALMLFCYLSSTRPKRYLMVSCGAVAGISLFWNLDSGLSIVGAFAATMLFQVFFSSNRRTVAKQFLAVSISGVCTILTLLTLLSIQQGSILSPQESLKYIQIFSSVGFMMLPMPGLPASWCFFTGIYLLGLLIGLRSFMAGRFEPWAKMSIFLSVLGIGLFTYYQGRSHIYNLPTVIWPSLLLLFIYTDRIIRLIKLKLINSWFKLLLLPAVLFMVCSIVTFACDFKMITAGIKRTFRGIAEVGNVNPLEANIRFILKNAGDKKMVNILSDMQGIYYAETGLRAGISDFGMIETLLKKDQARIASELFKAKYPLFISVPPGFASKVPPWAHKLYRLDAISNDGLLFYFTPKITRKSALNITE
ncbi:MAG: hypothetical protein WC071_04235 [Victivallaceae bacterium]